MFRDALDADVSVISFAKKLVGLVVQSAEFMVFSDFLLVTGELQDNEIFGEHVGLDLRVVLESTCGTV
jgi:hypothetical protein